VFPHINGLLVELEALQLARVVQEKQTQTLSVVVKRKRLRPDAKSDEKKKRP
jgi:hypothetical protein